LARSAPICANDDARPDFFGARSRDPAGDVRRDALALADFLRQSRVRSNTPAKASPGRSGLRRLDLDAHEPLAEARRRCAPVA
jgi:hypothetical protein